jgi:uncharacterized membrane protein YfcA
MDLFAGASPNELYTLAFGLLIAGVVSGLIAGLLGVGGGIVVVPVLYNVLAAVGVDESIRMHVAVGTSLAAIIPTSLSSMRAHAKRGAVDWALIRRWVSPMIAGVIIGALLAGHVSGTALTLVFVAVALPVAVFLAVAREDARVADRLPAGAGGALTAALIGGVSTMMGIGGGTVGVPTMTLCGVPIHRAVGTASAFGIIISLPGTVGMIVNGWGEAGLPPYSLGYVNLLGFALIAPASFIFAPIGAHLAHLASRKRLRVVFALFIALTALRMGYDVLL